jgi:hypothetical protein
VGANAPLIAGGPPSPALALAAGHPMVEWNSFSVADEFNAILVVGWVSHVPCSSWSAGYGHGQEGPVRQVGAGG